MGIVGFLDFRLRLDYTMGHGSIPGGMSDWPGFFSGGVFMQNSFATPQ
jgi:hypothetical protein